MKANTNELRHQVEIIQDALTKSPYVHVQIFVRVLSNVAKFGQGEPDFNIEELGIELGDEMRQSYSY